MTTPRTLDDDAIVRFLSGLWHLNRRMKQDFEPLLETHGLDMRRFFILLAIRKGTAYPKELSEKLQIPSTLLSRYLDQSVKQGLLERQIDEQDSRRTRLSITQQGAATIQAAISDLKAHTNQRLQNIDPTQLFSMLDAMEVLAQLPAQTETKPSKENKK